MRNEIDIPGLSGITDTARYHHIVLEPVDQTHYVKKTKFGHTTRGEDAAKEMVRDHNKVVLTKKTPHKGIRPPAPHLYTRTFVEESELVPVEVGPDEEADRVINGIRIKDKPHGVPLSKGGDGDTHPTFRVFTAEGDQPPTENTSHT